MSETKLWILFFVTAVSAANCATIATLGEVRSDGPEISETNGSVSDPSGQTIIKINISGMEGKELRIDESGTYNLNLNFANLAEEGASGAMVTYYKDNHHNGQYETTILSNDCFNLDLLNNDVSSFNTHSRCIIVYDAFNCTGEKSYVVPGFNDLNMGTWNDRVSSMQTCR